MRQREEEEKIKEKKEQKKKDGTNAGILTWEDVMMAKSETK